MKTKIIDKKIKKWSEFLADAAICKAKVYPVGSQFVYDEGSLPSGMTGISAGDILNLQRENGLSSCDVPGIATDWVRIDGNPGGEGGLDLTTVQTLTPTQKHNAAANIEDRAAVVQSGVVQSLGYKVLKAGVSFALQVTDANTAYEIKDNFAVGTFTMPANCTLVFNGGMLESGTLTGNNTIIDAPNDMVVFGDSMYLLGTWGNTDFYVDWWKCYADGVNDDYYTLKGISRTISENGGGNLIFPKKKIYAVAFHNWVATNAIADEICMNFSAKIVDNATECINVNVDLNGSEIHVIAGTETYTYTDNNNVVHTTTSSGFSKYQVISFRSCNGCLKNGIIKGDRLTHDYNVGRPLIGGDGWDNSSSHEWGYGVYVAGGTFEINNIVSFDHTGDGFYISYHTNKINITYQEVNATISNCESHHNRRQGISYAGGASLNVFDCNIHDIGNSDDITGTNPKSGIDLEFESLEHNGGNVYINNVIFNNCNGGSVAWSSTANRYMQSLVISNCKCINAPFHAFAGITSIVTDTFSYDIHDIYFKGGFVGSYQFSFPEKIRNITIIDSDYIYLYNNVQWENVYIDYSNTSSGRLWSAEPKNMIFKNCTLKHLHGPYNSSSQPGIEQAPGSGGIMLAQADDSKKTIANISFENCLIDDCVIQPRQKKGSVMKFVDSSIINSYLNNFDNFQYEFINSYIFNITSRSWFTQNDEFVFNGCTFIENRKDDTHAGIGINGKKIFIDSDVDAVVRFANGAYSSQLITAYDSRVKIYGCIDGSPNNYKAYSKIRLENCYYGTSGFVYANNGIDYTNTYINPINCYNLYEVLCLPTTVNSSVYINSLLESAELSGLVVPTSKTPTTITLTTAISDKYLCIFIPKVFGEVKCTNYPITKKYSVDRFVRKTDSKNKLLKQEYVCYYSDSKQTLAESTNILIEFSKWFVDYDLVNITTDNSSNATNGSFYTATLSAASGYDLPSAIEVVMGGRILTEGNDYTYDDQTGALKIFGIGGSGGVNGNVVISARGVSN